MASRASAAEVGPARDLPTSQLNRQRGQLRYQRENHP